MSLNTDNVSSWAGDNSGNNGNNAQNNGGASTAGTVQGGLAQLFGLSSMTSDNRNLNEAQDTTKELIEIYENLKKTSISDLQRKTIPVVESLTNSISPTLPGVGLKARLGDTMYVMVALFATPHLTINSERININMPSGYGSQQVSIPLTPVQYANKELLERVRDHYTRVAESEGVKHVAVINVLIVDLEMLNHPEAGDPKDRPRSMAMFIASEWEESIMVKSVQEIQASGQKVPNPFQNPQQPYGKDNCAEARVNAISGRVTKGKTLTPANMEIIASTISNNANSNNWNTMNSKEICRVQATVSLNAVSWDEFSRFIMSHRTPDQIAQLQSFLGSSAMGGGAYPNGYRPLRPVITMDAVQPGEMLGYNGGLYPYFYALYLLMSSNNNFVWAEAIRKHNVGARGNLADLEVRIQHMLSQMPGGMNVRQPAQVLDDKKITDTDFVNNWIRMNVSPHATFQVNLLPAGPHASIHNFLMKLAQKQNADEVKTVVAIIDAMSGNKLSAIIERNLKSTQGWNPSKPVLLPTGMIAVNGLATYGDKKLNTQELDEMMISHIKGKNGLPAIESFLGTQYGVNPQEEFKQRCQKLRIELTSSIFDGAVHINGFAQPHIWAPDFMSALGEAMDGIGQLNVANNIGSFRNNNLVFAPGVGLATVAAAGSNNPNGAGLGMNYNLGQPFM